MSHWLPKDWKKSIVLMEQVQENGKSLTIGTGVLVNFQTEGTKAAVVTCRHIAETENLSMRYNAKPGSSYTMVGVTLADLEKLGFTWCYHPDSDIDLAIMFYLGTEGFDALSIPLSLFGNFEKTAEGDEIFFLGFPLGISDESRVTPLVRSGIVALKKDDLTYLIDANTFPGSSGSPVFMKPSFYDFEIGILSKIRQPKLIGILQSSLTFTDYAISSHTGRPRVTFEENAALGRVYSIEIIKQLFDCEELQKQTSLAEKLPEFPFSEYKFEPSRESSS